ncbi:hypothetical protein ACFX2K_022785 [Malus domestica]
MVFFRCFKNNTITILAKEGELQDRGTTLKLYVQLTGLKALVLPAKDNLMHIKILILNPSHHAHDNSPVSFELIGDRICSGAMT